MQFDDDYNRSKYAMVKCKMQNHEYQFRSLLTCDFVQFDKLLPTFRRNQTHVYAVRKRQSSMMEILATASLKTFMFVYRVTLRHITRHSVLDT
jgi:hypothetical protein